MKKSTVLCVVSSDFKPTTPCISGHGGEARQRVGGGDGEAAEGEPDPETPEHGSPGEESAQRCVAHVPTRSVLNSCRHFIRT